MKNLFASLGRSLLTLAVVLVAVLAGWQLWSYYMPLMPWSFLARALPLSATSCEIASAPRNISIPPLNSCRGSPCGNTLSEDDEGTAPGAKRPKQSL